MTVQTEASDSRFPHGAFLWRGFNPLVMVTVCCKVTYDLAPGTSTVSARQIPLAKENRHWGDDESRSVFMPSDFVPTKPFAEVMLVGSAYAPKGSSVSTLDVRLGVGGWAKALRIVADRAPSGADQRFTSMPLVYERAARGASGINPVGLDSTASLPNIEVADATKTAGFGPLASLWPSRRKALGEATREPRWDELAQTGFPAGFSPTFFQSAPPDQWLEPLRGWIDLDLVHLHPDVAALRTRLPPLAIQAVEVRSGTSNMVNLAADTVWIHTDRSVATVTYRASMPAHGDNMQLLLGIVTTDGLPFGEGGVEDDPATSQVEVAAAPQGQEAKGLGMAALRPRSGAQPVRKYQTSTSVDVLGASIRREIAAPPPRIDVEPRPRPVSAYPSAPPAMPREASPAMPISPPPARAVEVPKPALNVVPLLSAVDASNRAADAPPADAALTRQKHKFSEAYALLWADTTASASLRRIEAWRRILKKTEERSDAGLQGDASVSAEDERDVLEVLRSGKVDVVTSIDAALATWIGASGGGRPPPLLLVKGTLRPVFDELKVLRALVAAARPYGKVDPAFQQKLDVATTFLREADDLTPPSDLALESDRLRHAFAAAERRTTPPDELDTRAARTLAERRAYKEVDVLGAPFVPVWLGDGADAAERRIGYLPKEAASRLPLTPRVDVRAVIEVVPDESHVETRAAFKVRAFARQLSLSSR